MSNSKHIRIISTLPSPDYDDDWMERRFNLLFGTTYSPDVTNLLNTCPILIELMKYHDGDRKRVSESLNNVLLQYVYDEREAFLNLYDEMHWGEYDEIIENWANRRYEYEFEDLVQMIKDLLSTIDFSFNHQTGELILRELFEENVR